jgi:DNA polymerase III sliding clamp (beta) subunit (PCNA family)
MLDYTSEFIVTANQLLDIDIDNVDTIQHEDGSISIKFHHDDFYTYTFQLEENTIMIVRVINSRNELVIELRYPKFRHDEHLEMIVSNFVGVPNPS